MINSSNIEEVDEKEPKAEPKKRRTRKKKQEEEIEEFPDMMGGQFVVIAPPGSGEDASPKIRTIGFFGDLDQEKASEIVYGMIVMRDTSTVEQLKDPDDPAKGSEEVCKPFELMISTYGGSALEMFGVYDTMRKVREDCGIITVGVGKVMSAGVLLLAAGTKGERKIGANCRVMIHGVMGGSHGAVADLENEMEEVKWIQQRFVKCLAEETDMTENYIKKLIKKKVNVYLDAEQAVELGIADIIV
jgi:ATP-dependent Clp endopeptidase proteolytic subunit ClpP